MRQDVMDAAERSTAYEGLLSALQSESERLLTGCDPRNEYPPRLVDHIQSLHETMQDQNASALVTYHNPMTAFGAIQARAPLVRACKSQSQVIFNHFQSLSEKARSLTQRFTEVRWTAPTTLRR